MAFKKDLNTAIKYTFRNKELSIASVLVLTIAFILINFFLLTSFITNRLVHYIRSQGVISILFDKESIDRINQLEKELQSRDDVLKTQIQTYDELSKRLIKNNLGEDESDLLSTQDANYLVTLRVYPKNPENIQSSKNIIDFINSKKNQEDLHIARIIYYEGIIQKVEKITTISQIVVITITIFMIIIAIVLVYITIGFTINKLKKEIEIMNLIGATKNAIEIPFAIQGALYGFISTFFAYLTTLSILYMFYYMVIKHQSGLLILNNIKNSLELNYPKTFFIEIIIITLFIELILGSFIGFICSRIATKSQLDKLVKAKLFKKKK